MAKGNIEERLRVRELAWVCVSKVQTEENRSYSVYEKEYIAQYCPFVKVIIFNFFIWIHILFAALHHCYNMK